MGRERYTPEEQAFYSAYMTSPAWRQRRAARLAVAGHRCEFVPEGGERCFRTKSLEVHHTRYTRLGAEEDCDLAVYCWVHHILEHLLWKKCHCGAPCLGDDAQAERWLIAGLMTLQIDPNNLPPLAKRPNKEYFLAEIPDTCLDCDPFLGGE